jgi:transposase
VERTVPAELALHVICDNSSTHKSPAIGRWLVAHPHVHLHFTPTYSSWLNLVERRIPELTSKWLRRGSHRSVQELEQSIRHWMATWNDHPRPFVWTKTADEILDLHRHLPPARQRLGTLAAQEATDRAVLSHRECDLIFGKRSSAVGALERHSHYLPFPAG